MIEPERMDIDDLYGDEDHPERTELMGPVYTEKGTLLHVALWGLQNYRRRFGTILSDADLAHLLEVEKELSRELEQALPS